MILKKFSSYSPFSIASSATSVRIGFSEDGNLFLGTKDSEEKILA